MLPLGTVQEDLASCAFSDAARTQDKATVRDTKLIKLWIFRRFLQVHRQILMERTDKNIASQNPIVIFLSAMNIQITLRDLEIFRLLKKLPLTTDQMFRLSASFHQPFNCQRILQRRLKRLADNGLLKRYYFAFARQGRSPAYWRLTRSAFRLISSTSKEPKRTMFSPIGVSLHFHSYHLNEFLICVLLAAFEKEVLVEEFNIECSLDVDAASSITPDATICFQTPNARSYRFFVELDTASERMATNQRIPSSIQKKLEAYERYHQKVGNSFRVLFLTTSSESRANNILAFANGFRENPASELVYAAYLPNILSNSNCLFDKLFRNHRGSLVGLLRNESVKV